MGGGSGGGRDLSTTSVLKNKRRDDTVPFNVSGVQQNQNQVEPAEQRTGQSHVHRERLTGIVLSFGVGSCQNCGSSIQFAHNSVERLRVKRSKQKV